MSCGALGLSFRHADIRSTDCVDTPSSSEAAHFDSLIEASCESCCSGFCCGRSC